jgi:hypothetical protein
MIQMTKSKRENLLIFYNLRDKFGSMSGKVVYYLKKILLKFEKVGIDRAVIELTRWCNMECAHCLRGERERLRIQKKYIDAFLDHVSYITMLTFTGGEPTLAIDLIEYTYEACIKRGIPVHNVWVTTNGKKKSGKFLDVMTKWIEYSKEFDGSLSGVSLSTDQFHDNLPEENYWFYRDYQYFEESKDIGFMKATIPEGRAAWNGLSTNDFRYTCDEVPNLQFFDEDLAVMDGLIYLNAKGDILFGCDYSFDNQDCYSRFNIEDPLGFVGQLLLQSDVELDESVYKEVLA